ncbi:DUF4138 domain-containing protein [Tamlana sp. 2201CG12-4]|uniref:DUF4138 domain-containing protein n=1 Tax=Tamlana sp. 2201CG12-4 TaxID=3112582 RepID=UPI002DB586A2|nr:DUF4138 domain-containing protein [Tamlana sp. 2201CG12-4]MEC3908793.1 DUF4138 domain-containing protein [Tamlana sp. 2201CG12-4]
MYIAISKQHHGENFSSSVRDFVNYLEKEQYFGLLQGSPGSESNLLTITNDGLVYSYILKYKDTISRLNYFISQAESIGYEKPKNKISEVKTSNSGKTEAQKSYYKKFCNYLLETKSKSIAVKRKKGVTLKLITTTYHKGEVYMKFEIRNNSEINFELDYLNVLIVNGNKKRKSSYQKLQQKVIYRYKISSCIKAKSLSRFIYVLPKFVLGKNEELQVEFQELNGSRSIVLKSKLRAR